MAGRLILLPGVVHPSSPRGEGSAAVTTDPAAAYRRAMIRAGLRSVLRDIEQSTGPERASYQRLEAESRRALRWLNGRP